MEIDIDRLGDRSFWLERHPEFHITDVPNASVSAATTDGSAHEAVRTSGYFEGRNVVDPAACAALATAVEGLAADGIPTPFLFVYDEVWNLLRAAGGVLNDVVGPNYLVGGDLWAWYVPPTAEGSGWAVHRDGNLGDAVRPDGSPDIVTAWIPLTEASPTNGCIYVLPVDRDPNVPDNLDVLEVGRRSLSSVRAVPASPGDVLGWSTRLLHWGGRSSNAAATPRISFSIYCCRADAENYADDFVPLDGAIPLHHRLGVICRALLSYEQSGLSGTTLPEGVHDFAVGQRDRLAKWLAMTADLQRPAQS
ncbi:MAG: hypothetical protein ACI9C1_000610 [Candidatus Aldehydirespiratoraceae bacterium]